MNTTLVAVLKHAEKLHGVRREIYRGRNSFLSQNKESFWIKNLHRVFFWIFIYAFFIEKLFLLAQEFFLIFIDFRNFSNYYSRIVPEYFSSSEISLKFFNIFTKIFFKFFFRVQTFSKINSDYFSSWKICLECFHNLFQAQELL